jgi:hypothetical protein
MSRCQAIVRDCQPDPYPGTLSVWRKAIVARNVAEWCLLHDGEYNLYHKCAQLRQGRVTCWIRASAYILIPHLDCRDALGPLWP